MIQAIDFLSSNRLVGSKFFQSSAGASSSTIFLDLTDRVLFEGEQGLLGLAFYPNFSSNGYFFVDYVVANPTRTVVSRFSVNHANPAQANKSSEFIILEANQPYSNLKGGQLAFGPDGFLYIGMGDGGSEGDPLGNGQNLSTMLGKILRIDVDKPSIGKNYGIPTDNPFFWQLRWF
jgi:glucose/arabinose dehydrogenase